MRVWAVLAVVVLNAACPGVAGEGEGEGACVEDLDCSLGEGCAADADCDRTGCANIEFDDDGVVVDGFVCDPADVLGSVCVATASGGRCGIAADGQGRCPDAAFADELQTPQAADDSDGNAVNVCASSVSCLDGACAL